jgi:hypothetical protein
LHLVSIMGCNPGQQFSADSLLLIVRMHCQIAYIAIECAVRPASKDADQPKLAPCGPDYARTSYMRRMQSMSWVGRMSRAESYRLAISAAGGRRSLCYSIAIRLIVA